MQTQSETMKLRAEVDGFLTQQLNAQMLKYCAGRAITCPGCGNVMDWRKTVSIDFYGVTTQELHATQALCCQCADKLLPGIGDRLAKAEAKAGEKIKVTMTDGRDYNEEGDYDPAPLPAMGPQVQFNAARANNPKGETVSGFEVSSGLPDWGRFVAYSKSEDLWWVCERQTGYAFARGESFKEAVIKGFRVLRSVGQEKYTKSVASVPVLNA